MLVPHFGDQTHQVGPRTGTELCRGGDVAPPSKERGEDTSFRSSLRDCRLCTPGARAPPAPPLVPAAYIVPLARACCVPCCGPTSREIKSTQGRRRAHNFLLYYIQGRRLPHTQRTAIIRSNRMYTTTTTCTTHNHTPAQPVAAAAASTNISAATEPNHRQLTCPSSFNLPPPPPPSPFCECPLQKEIKICLLGCGSVGKSALAVQYVVSRHLVPITVADASAGLSFSPSQRPLAPKLRFLFVFPFFFPPLFFCHQHYQSTPSRLFPFLNLAALAALPPVISISTCLQENRFVESYDPTVEDCYEKQIEINGLQVNPVTSSL